ncbi:hypothetical protein NC653_023749 [Populus alba x Populus x berolinensis]|uniref:Histidine-containing phosphotransfer protein n=1 Tax=Populus alba x Populus x berolinensis TaxID=444605 RepID=A0AAD6MIN3_9ROSI|nr:hypothetical protein NC653_023749 [Populus alba x Populus x berolinensis]
MLLDSSSLSPPRVDTACCYPVNYPEKFPIIRKCTQLYMDFGVAEEVEWKHLTDNLHHCFIASEQGIVNAQFCHIQTLKTEEEPDHVVRLINTYSIDVESILFELGSYIDLPDVDFSKLAALAQQVEERSSLMGAEHMRLACADLIQACRQMDKRNLSLSFNWIKNEFAHIRTKLEVIVQMERKIMRLESKHKK